MSLSEFTNDEITVLINLCETKVNEIQLYCLPNSLVEYVNQLQKIIEKLRTELINRMNNFGGKDKNV